MEDKTIKLMILDDDDTIRFSFMDYFEDCGWDIICTQTAEEALNILKTQSVDGAIVDIRLPGMDGNEFIIRACEQYRDMSFLICTGSPDYQIDQSLLSKPQVCSTLFHKPVEDLQNLQQTLMKLILENVGD